MREAFQEVTELVATDPGTLSDHLSKLTEEVGEFAAAVNMTTGRKTRKYGETDEDVLTNVVEEFADSIQVMVGILHKLGITYEDAVAAFHRKNQDYAAFVKRLNSLNTHPVI